MSRFKRGIDKTPRSSAPKCRPCRDGVHKNCPTAITRHTTGNFVSDYECPCYYADVDGHRDLVEENDAEHEWDQEQRRDESRWDSGPDGMLHGF